MKFLKRFFIILLLPISLNAKNVKQSILIQKEDYIIIFYPVSINGIIKNMEYFYKYDINFDLNIKTEVLEINKIEILLPSSNIEKNIFERKIFLTKAKYSFQLPIFRKENLQKTDYIIRFYITSPKMNQNNDYLEYKINTNEFKDIDIDEYFDN